MVRALGRYSTAVYVCRVLSTVRAAVLAAGTAERLMACSPPPAEQLDLDAATHPACFMAAVLPAGDQARDHRGGPGERKHDG